jgi:uncharacterized protein YjiS (DUF1127 family)
MDLSQIAGSISLHTGQALRLENGHGRRIAVLRGKVWVTQDGNPRDIVLQAGEEFVFDRPVTTVVSALGGSASIFRQDGVEIEPPRAGGQRGLVAALARVWAKWRDARRARLSARAISDHTLADIGLQRTACGVMRRD